VAKGVLDLLNTYSAQSQKGLEVQLYGMGEEE
jgi:hypothetical protein